MAGAGRLACRGGGRAIAAGDWVVGPADRVSGRASCAEPCVVQEFGDDSGVAHRPSGAWFQDAGGGPVLVVGPSGAFAIDGGACREVVGQYVGEAEVVALFGDAVAGEGQDAGGPAAPGVVVPESGPDP